MKRTYSFSSDGATLYLVATPIGNLDDMTYRAIETLKKVSYVYAEDTRNSGILLKHFNITTPLRSYHEFNKEIKNDEIIDLLKSGNDIAIISDAGNPVISDPGFNICKSAIENDIKVTTIPGACAYITALVSSGIPPMPNTFVGFLDGKRTKRIDELIKYKFYDHTLIFYEAPHRIIETLEDMLEVFGDRYICLARELTKKFEELIRGNISEILQDTSLLKGEMVIIVSGYVEDKEEINPIEKIETLISLGYKTNEAIKEVAKNYSIDRRKLYDEYVEYKNKK